MAGPTFDTVPFPAPVGGEAPSLPPDQLVPTQAQRLKNYLVHNPGRITPRGSIGVAQGGGPAGGSVLSGAGGRLLGTIPLGDTIYTTYRALNGPPANALHPLVDNWRIPISRTQADVDLAQPVTGTTAVGKLNVKTGAVVWLNAASALEVMGPSYCHMGNAVYAATFGGVAEPISIDAGTPIAVPVNAVRKMHGNDTAVSLTNGPRIVQAVFSHYGRVWAAAARKPGGTDYNLSQIFYTNPGGTTALTNVAADWIDPVTGELNVIEVGAANDGDFTLGFGRAAGHMLIFKRHSIWILYGTSPANFTLRQLTAGNGCVDSRSIAVCTEGTYFASQCGFELYDGSRFRLLSSPIADDWLPVANEGAASVLTTHAFIRSNPLPNGYLYACLGVDPHRGDGTPTNGTERGWLLHRPSGAWIDLRTGLTSMGLGPSGHLNRILSTGESVTAWGDAGAWARSDSLPYGIRTSLQDTHNAASVGVSLLWRSRVANIGGSWAGATLQRLSLDYRQEYAAGAVSAAAWGVATIRSGGAAAALSPAYSLEGALIPSPRRVRPVHPPRGESPSGEAVVEIESTIGADPALRHGRLDIHGASVGYRTGYERTAS